MTRKHSRGLGDERPDAAHDDTDPDSFFGESRSKQSRRKDRQLCGQVQRAVSSALSSSFDDEVLTDLWVVKVEPAPTVSRLMIWVAGPQGSSAELILARLLGVAGALRAEVAQAICRKQVPTLSFAICDGHEEADL
jgi:ribosome-binding factor A